MAAQPPPFAAKLPTASFSFTAPYPPSSSSSSAVSTPHKQRRVSLALPSSPRLFPAWSFRDDTGLGVHSGETSALVPEKKGKMRRIAADDCVEEESQSVPQQSQPPEKKQRKKWTMQETQMLVDGCNKWGVGNWKAILNDPDLKFDNRSPVDLKDRFRTYFPDAYKQHYPNAKTHLSSKVRSSLPDGTSIFEKTRSKKRRPFTEEEDRALKAGYDKHGTVWATIAKDPIFQEQNRRSTDLRDRFRNAFPDLYQAAGYKPRTSAKKNRGRTPQPARSATDDQLGSTSTAGPVRRKRRHTTQGLLRGGTKSVPESTTCSEDEDSTDEDDAVSSRVIASSQVSPPEESSDTFAADMDMQSIDSLADAMSIPDFIPSSSLSEMTDSSQTWPSSIQTPVHSNIWSTITNPASPTPSGDYFLHNSSESPYQRRSEGPNMMIGKSAWGPQDWLSANPRLEPLASSSSSSYIGGLSPTPSSPFSFANHGVLDRYDLFPASFAHDFASEVGMGDSHSTFSDPDMFAPSSFRGFTHHSNYAGDLIFGARTHQPVYGGDYGLGFGFGGAGLGLSGLQHDQQRSQPAGLHPMQMHATPLPGIDELELTAITLDDHVDVIHDPMEDTAMPKDDESSGLRLPDIGPFGLPSQTLAEIVGLAEEMHVTPPATPVTSSRPFRSHANMQLNPNHNHSRSVSVPPSEHRSAFQSQTVRAKPSLTPTRSLSLMDILTIDNSQISQPQPSFQSQIPSSAAYSADNWRPSTDGVGLPFLDLHYYTNGSIAEHPTDEVARQGQALDLAKTLSSSAPAFKPWCIPPSLSQHIPMSPPEVDAHGSMVGRLNSTHHRGQSAVSPQDLLLRKSGDTNKRKRASWDGGVR